MNKSPLCQVCRWSIVLTTFVVQSDIISSLNANDWGVLWWILSISLSIFLMTVVWVLKTARLLLTGILLLSIGNDIMAAMDYLNRGGIFYEMYIPVTNFLYYCCISILISKIVWVVYNNRSAVGDYLKILERER